MGTSVYVGNYRRWRHQYITIIEYFCKQKLNVSIATAPDELHGRGSKNTVQKRLISCIKLNYSKAIHVDFYANSQSEVDLIRF